MHEKGGHHAKPFKAMRPDQGMASRKQDFTEHDILSRYFAWASDAAMYCCERLFVPPSRFVLTLFMQR